MYSLLDDLGGNTNEPISSLEHGKIPASDREDTYLGGMGGGIGGSPKTLRNLKGWST